MFRSPENATALRSEIRNPDAIGKAFNLWVNQACSHEMDFIDIDGLTFKKSRRLLRLFEAKHWNEALADSQEKRIFPLLARLLGYGVAIGVLAEGSGLFVVRGDAPYAAGAQVQPWPGRPVYLTLAELVSFIDGAPLMNEEKSA